MATTTVFRARKIVTMNPSHPVADHVAVRDGRILGVGSEAALAGWGAYRLNTDFADLVLLPGFVEGHAHAAEGQVWRHRYVGYQDRRDPQGKLWSGAQSLEAVIAALQEAHAAMKDADSPLFAWGLDPIYFDNRRMTLRDLDRVSSHRPILIMHSNGHLMNVNRRILEMAGIDSSTDVHGILKDEDGQPTGELMEMAAHYMAYRQVGSPLFGDPDVESLIQYSRSARNVGVTTATDLFASLGESNIRQYVQAAGDGDFSLRLMPAMNTLETAFDQGIDRVRAARRHNSDKLAFGLCKVMTDGSIQGFTGRLKWPGYYRRDGNGLWNMPPEQLCALVEAYHEAGMHLHIHTNGDEASELMIDAIEQALHKAPRPDHRHTLQHCQMADAAQFRRMARLGICANLFANHIYFWGDQHAGITMGRERAEGMDACATALRHGVPLAIHSDAPVTPLAPLFTAWCAVNRRTMSGEILGAEERIDTHAALHAITLGPAYTLKMDHLVGSVECGKFADFAVLEEDPLSRPPEAIKDIPVWGTVLGGTAYPGAGRR